MAITDKVWKMADVLRKSGVAFTDYVAQLTYLLFLKMDAEQAEYYEQTPLIPAGCRWQDLLPLDGPELAQKYSACLKQLAECPNIIGVIYYQAANKITAPANLRRVIEMIDGEQWCTLDEDVKGTVYESILEKNASAEKGAGQYFTPRALIRAIVEVMRPQASMSIHDPFCGTGGFLLGAYEYIRAQHTEATDLRRLQDQGLSGNDITPLVVSLGSMNMYLHGIGCRPGAELPIRCCDTFARQEERTFDMVLANPPFGTGASTQGSAALALTDDRFFAPTANSQLNAVQHIMAVLKPYGRAAVVVPDNVLFESGAGEQVRRRLLSGFNLHTILRLPTGIFYAQGVQANVLFFDKRPADRQEYHTDAVWVYDYRTDVKHTLVRSPLSREHLQDFVDCYCAADLTARRETYSPQNPNGRWRRFPIEEVLKRPNTNFDFRWLTPQTPTIEGSVDELLDLLADEITTQNRALAELRALLTPSR